MQLGILCVVGAYVCGSIPFGLIIARARGIDLREVGSGNIGATNATRALGKVGGGIVLALDALKGLVPVLITRWIMGPDEAAARWIGGVMLAAVLGHIFSAFLRLRGGKGVSTGLGVTLAAWWPAGLVGALVYAGALVMWRTSSLGSLLGVGASTVMLWISGAPRELAIAGSGIAALILVRHVDNIKRLLEGDEGKV